MEIINKKLSEIKPYENNPRINDNAVDYVAKSIQEFGFKNPIIVDKNNVIIAGHTRYKASKKLGLKEVPCVVADDLTEEKVRAYRLADNKTADYSIWDNKLLLEELEEIDNNLFTGFEVGEIFDATIDDEDIKDTLGDNSEGVLYRITFETDKEEKINKIKEIWEGLENE